MSIPVLFICNDCDKEILVGEAIEEASREMLCTICFMKRIAGSEKYHEIYQRCLSRAYADLLYIQSYSNKHAFAYYQLRSLFGELKKSLKNGGYLDLGYMREKCDTLINQAKTIPRGVYIEQ